MYRVLLADDEPMILEGMQRLIRWEELGLEIGGLAENGEAALAMLRRERFDILITDIRMPGMDGLSLLREARVARQELRAIVLSGYDDFAYVKEAARLGIENYLLKPVNEEELLSTLLLTVGRLDAEARERVRTTQDSTIIRDNLLLRWVTGAISLQELAMRLDVLGIEDLDARYAASVIHLPEAAHADLRETASLCRRTLDGVGVFVFPSLQRELVLLFRDREAFERQRAMEGEAADGERIRARDRERLLAHAERCVARIRAIEGREAIALVGGTKDGPEGVAASFAEAQQMREYALLSRDATVLGFDEMNARMARLDVEFHVDYPALRQLVRDRSVEGICGFADAVFARLAKTPGVSPAFIRSVAMRIGLFVTSTASMLRSGAQDFCDEMDVLFAEAWRTTTIDELKGWIRNVADAAVSLLREEEKSLSPAIRQVLHYIETQHHRDVALKSIAHDLNMNAIYLGQLFKNETGQMFSTYVNNLRIEKAKQMLLGTKLSVVEVGQKVGYASNNHFHTVFRKATGSSPTEFRRLNA